MEVEEVVRAICAIYDPSTSNPDRMKCTQIIENFKDGPPEVVANTAFELISQNSSILRHTGWTLLEDLIRYKWNSIPPELCLALRNRIFQAIDTLVQEETAESCARCVVAMMEHEWPQNWPELTSQLQEICSRSSLYCAIVFAIQRRLVENVATLASVANVRRRKDMHGAMVESVDDFLTLALDKLDSCPLDQTNLLAARNIFGWLIEIIENFKDGPPEVVANTAFELISQNSSILRHTGWTLLEDLIRYKWNSIPPELCLALRNRIFQAIDTLVQEYLRNEACDVLVALSSHALFREDEHLIQSLRTVFSNMLRAFTKHGYPSQNPPTPASHYSQMDFEDDLEWHNFFMRQALIMSTGNKTLNRHVISLILRAVQYFPNYFKDHVADVVALYAEVDGVISKMQMAQLLQVLAVLSNIVDDESVRVKLLQMAVAPSVEHIRSIEWSLENVSTFIKFNGFDVMPADSVDSPCNINRVELFLIELWDLKVLRKALIFNSGSVGENIEIITGRSTTVEADPINVERQYVYDLNDQILTIIATSASKFADKLFTLSDLPQLLLGMVSSFESVPEFRLRCWIKKVW
ncbi:hypothetical protein TELCIR_02845 [Teladorsagia circumcincta]|uniref:Uncharacterized protein n=1 Tax=Teladorsagia circumcincta TaxID=45464 RepID=A0A2G9UY67_TELCI|nr:hypothetical protein TELCIR_02845 [Teladorsagia circumcincta]